MYYPYPSSCYERTYTVYSDGASIVYQPGDKPQRFLKNRVASTYTDAGVYTYYSYDPHGNVEWIIQDIPGLGKNYIRYEYNLISGNVLKVCYNEGKPDAFYHAYGYDEDNRIKSV